MLWIPHDHRDAEQQRLASKSQATLTVIAGNHLPGSG
jgi:hypothetical protein